jgi:hypothetical protein
LIKNAEEDFQKFELKNFAKKTINVIGKNTKIFMTPNQLKLFILNDAELVIYDLDTLNR